MKITDVFYICPESAQTICRTCFKKASAAFPKAGCFFHTRTYLIERGGSSGRKQTEGSRTGASRSLVVIK